MTQIDISQFLFYQSSRPRTLDKLSNPIATNSVESIHTQSKQATPTTFTSQSKESTLDKSIADLTTIITVDDAIENVADSNKNCCNVSDNGTGPQRAKEEVLQSNEECIGTQPSRAFPTYSSQSYLDQHQDVEDSSWTIEQNKEQCNGIKRSLRDTKIGDSKNKSKKVDASALLTKTKRPLFTTTEQPRKKRQIKRHRFSSPFSSDETSELELDKNCRPTPLSGSRLTSRSTHSHSRDIREQQNETLSHHMTVIYEQKHWEGVIVDERDEKQGRGRPRKQYLVQWKSSWVDGAILAAPALLQQWRETKTSRNDRGSKDFE